MRMIANAIEEIKSIESLKCHNSNISAEVFHDSTS